MTVIVTMTVTVIRIMGSTVHATVGVPPFSASVTVFVGSSGNLAITTSHTQQRVYGDIEFVEIKLQ